ncbi:hypothetical protein DYBT9623_00682 [Dyadobacter sp. CECT 9623]|uniref:DUF4878 domain-containing protein n=1 Tax=Dyadobacter linearis TaxID=2823330 RepID=A0ABM8UKZ8_9BACT|nr:hypothetical protein [Dyadobacter sp. CECT 9623]CAG5067954.1 hypothetical protein DYBT9623_00682 [Dyadobacter sp. CECT 9623]
MKNVCAFFTAAILVIGIAFMALSQKTPKQTASDVKTNLAPASVKTKVKIFVLNNDSAVDNMNYQIAVENAQGWKVAELKFTPTDRVCMTVFER